MEQRIRERFSDSILAQVAARYGIRDGEIRLLDGFESFMYEYSAGVGRYILRIAHSFRRSEELIQGEVEWISFLAEHGTPVAPAVLSAGGRLVERIPDSRGESFLATAFRRAEGGPLPKDRWDEAFCERYGALIGRMHRLSRIYEPSRSEWRRLDWNDPVMLDVESHIPSDETEVVLRYRELLSYLASFSRGGDNYGLIHQDAHAGNFFVDSSGNITLFDFDDCVYSWYANDIAIVLFYAITNRDDAVALARWFMPSFIRGYIRESEFDPEWLRQMQYFLKLREIDLYAVIHRSFDVEHLEEHHWCAKFMAGRRERIEQGIPYLECDLVDLI